jgi:hypothetical protein
MEDGYVLKHLFENLFGKKAWYDVKHSTDIAKWKKYCDRLLSAIEVSANATVQIADDHWFDELAREVSHGKKLIKLSEDFEQLFANLAGSLGNISFLQLGLIPTRLSQASITLRHSCNWQLDHYRSVQYVQNQQQMTNLQNKLSKKDVQKT